MLSAKLRPLILSQLDKRRHSRVHVFEGTIVGRTATMVAQAGHGVYPDRAVESLGKFGSRLSESHLAAMRKGPPSFADGPAPSGSPPCRPDLNTELVSKNSPITP